MSGENNPFNFLNPGPERRKKEARKKRDNSLAAIGLKSEIHSDKTISDVTREELLKQANSAIYANNEALTGSIRNTYAKAKEGIEPKYKQRQATQAVYETLFDQPGRRQTIAASSNRNNRLIG